MSLLTCQLDPTRREGQFHVLACTPRSDGLYEVLLDDSVLYAEGGGQPADRGWIGEVAVQDVQASPTGPLHLAFGPVPLGPALLRVDWTRRFDHMQQHSAQHLLTALALRQLGLRTVGFHLGEAASTIDLDGPLSEADRDRLAGWANEEVRADRPVRQRLAREDEMAGVRSRGLPDGHSGPVRVVEIEGLDLNTCGGTHVDRLGQLQAIHLSRTERHKGGTRLYFLAGDRVLASLDAARDRDRALGERLSGPPERFVEAVERLQQDSRAQARRVEALENELARLLGARLAQEAGPAHLHRPEATMRELLLMAEAAGPTARLVLTAGQDEVVFLVAGPPEWVATVGPLVSTALGGRGGGRAGRFQGKATGAQSTALHERVGAALGASNA